MSTPKKITTHLLSADYLPLLIKWWVVGCVTVMMNCWVRGSSSSTCVSQLILTGCFTDFSFLIKVILKLCLYYTFCFLCIATIFTLIQNQYIPKWVHIPEACRTIKEEQAVQQMGLFHTLLIHCNGKSAPPCLIAWCMSLTTQTDKRTARKEHLIIMAISSKNPFLFLFNWSSCLL